MKLRWTLLLALTCFAAGIEKRVIFPPGAKPVGPYSPGIFAGEFLYVSGQGARGPNGQMPGTFEEQARQCLENVKSVVETAGLTMEHVIYTASFRAVKVSVNSCTVEIGGWHVNPEHTTATVLFC